MFPKENGAPAVATQDIPDRTKLNTANPIELSPASQAESRPSAAVFEALCWSSREEIGALLSEIAARAETGCIYVGLGDERGLRYTADNIVSLAVRMGDEALQLRRLRSEARAAEADRLSVLRQGAEQ